MSFGDYEGTSLRSGFGTSEDESGFPSELCPFVMRCISDKIDKVDRPITFGEICDEIAAQGGDVEAMPIDGVLAHFERKGYFYDNNDSYELTSAGRNYLEVDE